ncbi:MAG: acetylxylan esterase [Armatimonadetes bacterium]|nr:acetylxylan esterase [Armatimonadota bacterium]
MISRKTVTLILAFVWSAGLSQAAPVTVVRPVGRPPLDFAAQEVARALESTGAEALVTADPPKAGPSVLLKVVPGAAESFVLRVRGQRIEVSGGDVRGAMYGGLEVAEQIRLGGGLKAVGSKSAKPHLPVRAFKFNIPLPGVGYAGAESLKYNQWFYDLDYWRKFIEMMAHSRYNALSFWSAHPFDRMLKLGKYPEATDLPPEELKRNQEFFHRLFLLAQEHGVDTYLITWNIHVSAAFAKAHNLPSSGFNSDLVRSYQKECIREVLTQYPELTGLGTCPGESMGPLNVVQRENWIRETYLRGIEESGRTVPFILRYWGGEPKATSDMLAAAQYPGPVYLDIKFNGEHMYSSPRSHLQNKLWLTQEPKHYKLLWHLRNDDLFTLRWGDPDFVRDTVRNCGGRDSAGFVMGSEIEIPGADRIHTEQAARHKSWEYEFEKQWFRFLLWGRLGYAPDEPKSLWVAHYGDRFGRKAGQEVYKAVRLASKILPTVTAFHWNYMNGDWYPEGCVGSWNTSAEMPRPNYRDREMFHSVEEFLWNNTIDASMEDIPTYVLRTIGGRSPRSRGAGDGLGAVSALTPPEIARQLGGRARAVLRALPTCSTAVTRNRSEWECSRLDLEALSALGQYYEQKIESAVALGRFLMTGDESERAASLRHLKTAARVWRQLSDLGDQHYRQHEVWLFGDFSWGKYQSAVERDLELVRRAVALPRSEKTWETWCELQSPGGESRVVGPSVRVHRAVVRSVLFDEKSKPEVKDWLHYLNQLSAPSELVVPARSGKPNTYIATTKLLSTTPAQWEFRVTEPETARGAGAATFRLDGETIQTAATSRDGSLSFEASLRAGENEVRVSMPLAAATRKLSITAEPLPWREAVAQLKASEAQQLVAPMQAEPDSSCGNGKALFTPRGVGRGFNLKTGEPIDNGRAEFSVALPEAGEYVVIARCYWPDGAANSFYVFFDEGSPQVLGNEDVFDRWHWVTSPVFNLSAGAHRLVVRNREDGARMDRIVLATKEAANMTLVTPPSLQSAEVLTASEREQFVQRYFTWLTQPKPLSRFRTKEEWLSYRASLREKILQSLGLWPLPERVPLSPQVTGRLDHEDYSVERVLYQVFPKVYASGYLYVPKDRREGRLPAILNPHGHWPQGAVDPVVQTRCIALAKKGYVAFCPDSTHVVDLPFGLCPIGQMTWNNLRALDYLESLPFVDSSRIGCTGASGGGQQTMYLAAVDERIKVPVPVVMISYFRRILFSTEDAHCFCNHVPGIAAATDETEMVAMFAPRPTRFICATGDWTKQFPKEEFPEIRHIFDMVAGDVDCVQFNKNHNYDQDSREQMYAWMNKYLKSDPDPDHAKEPPITAENPETLKALSKPVRDGSGLEGASAFYREKFLFHAPQPRNRSEWGGYLKDLRSHLGDLLGEGVPECPLSPQLRGTVEIQGLKAEQLLLSTEPAVTIPAWLFVPQQRATRSPAVVVIHPGGKQTLLRDRALLVRALLDRGVIVLAVDTRMRGELRRNWQWNEVIFGRPEDGMAAHDLIRASSYLRSRSEVDPQRVYVVGLGEAGLFALYAAGLDPDLAGAALDTVGALYQDGRSTNVVPNVLRYGDLPQFAALVAPRPLWLNGTDGRFGFTEAAYRKLGGSSALRRVSLTPESFDQNLAREIADGMKEGR